MYLNLNFLSGSPLLKIYLRQSYLLQSSQTFTALAYG